MTREDEDLLLKDLTCRLTYGVKAHYKYYDFFGGEEQLADEGDGIITAVDTDLGNPIKIDGYYIEVENVKPYLRPLESQTDEEMEERSECVGDVMRMDYYYSHHLDCHQLIKRGLALQAPEDMYKNY